MFLTFKFADEIFKCDHREESLLNEHYFPVVLFIMLYMVVITFESVDKMLNVTIQMKDLGLGQQFPVQNSSSQNVKRST